MYVSIVLDGRPVIIEDSRGVRVDLRLPSYFHADTLSGKVEPSDPGEQ
jgi:hypothetical protein